MGGDVLDVWPNEVVQRVQIGGGGEPVREGYKVVALLLKPSLGLFGLVESCCYTQGLPPATWLHQGITTLFSTPRYTLVLTFKPTSKMLGGMMWPSLETTPKTITVGGNFAFISLCTSLLFDRRLLSLLEFLHNWSTSRWSTTTKKQKNNRFSLNGNGIMSFFLGRQFYRSTLYWISTIVSFLMPNPFYTVLFQTFQGCQQS